MLAFVIFLAFSLILLCSVRIVYAGRVTLEWDPVMHPDHAGYVIYYGTSSRDYDVSMDVGEWTSATIGDLEDGETYYFAASSYTIHGKESGYSDEVCINCATASTIESSGDGGGGGG